jgi:hypothetical protein
MPTGFFKFKENYSILDPKKPNKINSPNPFVIKRIYLCVYVCVCVCACD